MLIQIYEAIWRWSVGRQHILLSRHTFGRHVPYVKVLSHSFKKKKVWIFINYIKVAPFVVWNMYCIYGVLKVFTYIDEMIYLKSRQECIVTYPSIQYKWHYLLPINSEVVLSRCFVSPCWIGPQASMHFIKTIARKHFNTMKLLLNRKKKRSIPGVWIHAVGCIYDANVFCEFCEFSLRIAFDRSK